MIVKNESHIIHESLKCTLPLVDTFCIVDTGSTDNTIEVIKAFYKENGIEGEVHERPWKNFGHNRSEAVALCDGKMDYCLVIDADDLMGFPEDGKKQLHDLLEREKPNCVTIKIRQEGVNYMRGQLFKANDGWKYKGVLHEYPANDKPNNKEISLPDTFYMISRRLGDRNKVGNKMERDIAVLLKGIEDEPDNERYVFYLAQSYFDSGDFKNGIKWYKKRYHMGRWPEEAWYSAYRVGLGYKCLGNLEKFEQWMQRAHTYRPSRAEPYYTLTEHFRIVGDFYKAYHYLQHGRKIEASKDVLFVETFPHEGGFDYEASILDYYVQKDKKIGLMSSIQYLLKQDKYIERVVANLLFYITPISKSEQTLNIPSIFGEDFRPSSVSVVDYPFANVRFVNYLPPVDGAYRTKDGGNVYTKNAYMNILTGECLAQMDDETIGLAKNPSNVCGLEDIRLYKDSTNTLKYTATNYYEYSEGIKIMNGTYNYDTKSYINSKSIKSPENRGCEKNWLPIPGTDVLIYDWFPLKIGKIVGDEFKKVLEYTTPPLFKLFRGSSSPIYVNNSWWTLVHFAELSSPRKYYHCFVELDSNTYVPKRVTLPFVFKSISVEYSLSTRLVDSSTIECYVSLMDSNPTAFQIDINTLNWVPLVKEDTRTVIRQPENAGVYWLGKFSEFNVNGPMESFTQYVINSKNLAATTVLTQTDGFMSQAELDECMLTYDPIVHKNRCTISPPKLYYDGVNQVSKTRTPIICTLATRDFDKDNILYLPLDDGIFLNGLEQTLAPFKKVMWSEKHSKLFWRGNLGGYEKPTKRVQVVEKLLNNPNADAKIALSGVEVDLPPELLSERCSFDDHFKYKYIMIIDGVTIASNHQWIFGTGSVPVMVTHPKNNFWFKKFLKPMENYVPIKYDLSDLDEKLEWLIQNDAKALEIARNAKRLAENIFEARFQQQYVHDEIVRIASQSNR